MDAIISFIPRIVFIPVLQGQSKDGSAHAGIECADPTHRWPCATGMNADRLDEWESEALWPWPYHPKAEKQRL